MKVLLALVAASMVVSPATAGAGQTYVCRDDEDNKLQAKIGPGEFRYFDETKGAWLANLCTSEYASKTCRSEGSNLVATGGGHTFKYDAATGRFKESSTFGTWEGTCRPE